MAFTLPSLPYAPDALQPHISAETLDYHHGKHHQAYVDTLNKLVDGSDMEGKSLEQIVKQTDGKLFNQAAQVWNHAFYWNCLTPAGCELSGELATAIDRDFGSQEAFRKAFEKKALGNFASGWTWLVRTRDGNLDIVNTSDADTPIAGDDLTPLFVVDIWEHAYYIDYRNARADYLKAIWKLANWEFVTTNFEDPSALTRFDLAA